MKTILTLLLTVAIAIAAYVVGTLHGGKTIALPAAEWTDDSQAAQSWRKFLVSLEAAGAEVYASTEDSRERLMGLEYLAQLASVSLEMKLAKGDPAVPALTDWMSDYRKFLGDSPDAVYMTAEISASHQYQISGNIGDASYLGFMLYGKSLNGWNRAADNISLGTMTVSEAGDFSLLLSRERPDGYQGNWLQLEDDIHMVMVRQYFHDRASAREASVAIRALEEAGYQPPQDELLALRLDQATAFFNDTFSGNLALMEMVQKNANSFDTPKEYNAEFGGVFYPTHDNLYFGTWVELAEDEAVIVEGVAPDVDYWSISLQNQWMQTYDYRYHPVTLNNRDIAVSDDGRYQVVISAENPGVENWLSTAGLNRGLLAIRYQLAQESEPPQMRVVKVSDLALQRGPSR